MARLITKFKYLKPEDRKNVGGYAEYIATREGVEKIDESKRNATATNKQKQLIKKILSDFPDSKSSLEYEDYLKDKTVGAASEFITRALEENADEMMHTTTYADYIATRPRAERIGSHGLFTDDGVAVDLQKVSDELNAHTGNVWTAIVSLRREDAERLGYDNGSRWRDMLRSQTQALSENLKIPMSNLRWFAAFHNESYHPHVHMIVYSTDPTEGYLSEKGLMALRSSFAKDIFAQDLLCEYKKQTEHRDTLKAQSREVLAELIAKINGGIYDNSQVETLLQTLAKRLAVTNGKKQYGYTFNGISADDITLNGKSLPEGSYVIVLDEGRSCIVIYGMTLRTVRPLESVTLNGVSTEFYVDGDKPRFDGYSGSAFSDVAYEKWEDNPAVSESEK